MKVNAAVSGWGKKLGDILGKYKYIFLVILVGVALLLLPGGGGKNPSAQAEPGVSGDVEFNLPATEKKLAGALSQIQGAGRVTVVLTLKSSARQVVAQDDKTSDNENSLTTVVVARGSGTEDAVVLQRVYPQFRGALVVCPGGGSPAVRLKLTEAVAAVTGLGANRISICQGN